MWLLADTNLKHATNNIKTLVLLARYLLALKQWSTIPISDSVSLNTVNSINVQQNTVIKDFNMEKSKIAKSENETSKENWIWYCTENRRDFKSIEYWKEVPLKKVKCLKDGSACKKRKSTKSFHIIVKTLKVSQWKIVCLFLLFKDLAAMCPNAPKLKRLFYIHLGSALKNFKNVKITNVPALTSKIFSYFYFTSDCCKHVQGKRRENG